ncbi:hypothetical protein DI09_67p190 [Mitosporidium daphniae]|uniref:tRNA (adenine(58)-N(1))-methyltransferase catalytic subunit TRM61 n=1 Tax=Mitosporidium daphniae TaxID=1485682 RepID=A0A098VS23_9MICR|nr:uncharacterized protein DI09_67p190 [Mitosporidium daphniae]KGG50531.1 hypothetical protein DI09_67p190 [Mitosporidium daphniae]|eukprot:XP_013236958.1 uncharacterized protein DI09_67p190 [Mitosporidium daphniae]
MALGLKPGSVVIECGTGSASFSHHILRAIAPHGHLYTFEFHKERAEAACKELRSHGLGHDLVDVIAEVDVTVNGFGSQNRLVSAVFLDLPNPWSAIVHAKKTLSPQVSFVDNFKGGRICTFSPCIEQVQKAVSELRSSNFTG